jgi:potassium channel subfamily K
MHSEGFTIDTTDGKSDSNDPEALVRKRLLRRIRTAPALTAKTAGSRKKLGTVKKEAETALRSASWSMSVVSQAFLGLLLYLAAGVTIYTWMEEDFSSMSPSTHHHVIDAIYFCIVTMCTIGYGDIVPRTPLAKLFSCAFVLVGFGFIDILLSGMVSYVLDKQEALLLNSVALGHHEVARSYLVDMKKGRMRIRSKVVLAFGVVVMCIGVGAVVMHFLESLCWLDSFYLSCMSVTTVGYGDLAFKTAPGRLFASVWLLVSTLAVARSVIFLAEAQIEKRHRLLAKLVLEKEMTLGDLVAADLDNDGCVRYWCVYNVHGSMLTPLFLSGIPSSSSDFGAFSSICASI